MNFKKRVFGIATGCFLFASSGGAWAVDCSGGTITYATVAEIVIDGQDCFIKSVRVTGNVTISNSASVTFIDNLVEGYVHMIGNQTVNVLGNTIKNELREKPTRVNDNDFAAVDANIVDFDLFVNNNLIALVQQNAVGRNLVCIGNIELDDVGNRAGGDEECPERL